MRTSTLALFAFLLRISNAHAQDIIYDVGNKRPEGIEIVYGDKLGLTADVPYALVSEAYYGGIKAFDLKTGELAKQVVASKQFKERGSLGMTYHNGFILAAGGGNLFGTSAGMYVYDAMTGAQIVECLPDFDTSAMLMNDVVVINDKAYWTLSFSNKIPVMDLAAVKSDTPSCGSIQYIDLPAEIFPTDGESIGMNGIIPYGSGVLINHHTNGGVYFVDLGDGNSVSEALATGSLTNPDGMVAGGDKIYISELEGNKLIECAVSSRSGKKVVALTNCRPIKSEFYDNPATIDIEGNTIYAVNLRAYSPGLGLLAEGEEDPSTFSESFHIVGASITPKFEAQPEVTNGDCTIDVHLQNKDEDPPVGVGRGI